MNQGPETALHQVRRAVLATLTAQVEVAIVACSGGADSLALAAGAARARAQRARSGHDIRLVGVTIDHQLQPDSATQADRVLAQLHELGYAEAHALAVRVDQESGLGLEAAARSARYAALQEFAESPGFNSATNVVVLLGHTLDDQAETVLLGLTRGSGPRSLAGMPTSFGIFHRPMLQIRRSQTQQICASLGLNPWADPHNSDPRFTRARIRHEVLPLLEKTLGPGIAQALARTASLTQLDVAALDEQADQVLAAHPDVREWQVAELAELAPAIRSRVLRQAALLAGCPAADLSAIHLAELEKQVFNTTLLPKQIQLPGRVEVIRSDKMLRFGAELDRPDP